MERVGALIDKLKAQYDQNVDKKTLEITVQLILAELENQQPAETSRQKVAVILPRVHRIQQDVPSVTSEPVVVSPSVPSPPPSAPPPPVETAAPEAAPKKPEPPVPQPHIPETIKSYVLKPPPQPAAPVRQQKKEEQSGWLFDPADDVPTLTHQKEVYELNDVHLNDDSLNNRLKEEKTELGNTIKGDPVADLRKAIGINDRYRFINELFRGDEAMYERSIKTINAFTSLPEAQTWIQRELKVKIGWNETNPTVKDFDQVVSRRFS